MHFFVFFGGQIAPSQKQLFFPDWLLSLVHCQSCIVKFISNTRFLMEAQYLTKKYFIFLYFFEDLHYWKNAKCRRSEKQFCCLTISRRLFTVINKTSRNESSCLRYLPWFWPVGQTGAAVENNLSLSQNTPITILGYVLIDASIELLSLNLRFTI